MTLWGSGVEFRQAHTQADCGLEAASAQVVVLLGNREALTKQGDLGVVGVVADKGAAAEGEHLDVVADERRAKQGSASGSLDGRVTRCRLTGSPELGLRVTSSTSCRLWKIGSKRLVK